MKILIIEDDKGINKLLSEFLQKNSYETLSAFNGSAAVEMMKNKDVKLILMDLMLPFLSGEELIKRLRQYSDIPVIVVSAKSMMETRLEVLRLGADDYILKPFDLNEVLVRIEVVLRRSGIENESVAMLVCGGLCLNKAEKSVTFDGAEISLTAKEYTLLELFMERPKKVYSKANLYESVWNDVYYYEDNTVNVHISNLRSKLKKAVGRDCIETVWGIGYRFKEDSQ